MPISADSFESRKALPEAYVALPSFLFPSPSFSAEVVLMSWGVNRWRGIRDEALDQITGIPGCIFVHAGGFIGGTSLPSSSRPPFPHLRSRLTSREQVTRLKKVL